MQQPLERQSWTASGDFLPLTGIDYIEFWAGNARQSAHFYRTAFGMKLVAYRGPETGWRETASWVVEQGQIRFVLTSALRPDHPVAEHVRKHGDGVHDIALRVDDAALAWRETTARGARSIRTPETLDDDHGSAQLAAIHTYGDTIHTFVERAGYGGPFLPGFTATAEDTLARPAGLEYIDHVVSNVGLGDMNRWVAFYRQVMGFQPYQYPGDLDIGTEYAGQMSKVMANGSGTVKFHLNEPVEGRRKSEAQEFLDYYQGPGAGHIAMATADLIGTVTRLRAQGVRFPRVPASYYQALAGRAGPIGEPIEDLERLGILADRDDEGYLLQIFTGPIGDRPTTFFEIIQREGSRGSGKGNFKALLEAAEREQAARGNL